jgi:hypothetical protein
MAPAGRMAGRTMTGATGRTITKKRCAFAAKANPAINRIERKVFRTIFFITFNL